MMSSFDAHEKTIDRNETENKGETDEQGLVELSGLTEDVNFRGGHWEAWLVLC